MARTSLGRSRREDHRVSETGEQIAAASLGRPLLRCLRLRGGPRGRLQDGCSNSSACGGARSLAIDPLPPAAGIGVVGRWVPENEWAPTLTVSPMVNYLVFPRQDVWSLEVPAALSKKIGNHFVVYAGPKYLQQSDVLEKESGFVQSIVLSGVPKRDEQELRFGGAFAGFAFGWLHLQFSPEVIYYESLDDENPEQVIPFGTQIRISL